MVLFLSYNRQIENYKVKHVHTLDLSLEPKQPTYMETNLLDFGGQLHICERLCLQPKPSMVLA